MTQRPQVMILDGKSLKAVPIDDLPDSAFAWYSGGVSEEVEQVQDYFRTVPWIYRGVTLRAQAITNVPFTLTTGGGDEYDNSKDWENKVGFMANPNNLFYLVEAALTLLNRAYLFVERNQVRVLDLRYLLPTSITPLLDEEKGLLGFNRALGAKTMRLEPSDIIYFWRPDPFKEVGPSDNSPAAAALKAAGVLYSTDEFAASFFKRGAIKALLLTVEGNPREEEKKKLKSWWQRAISGVGNAWTTEVISSAVKPVVVGEGVQELANTDLISSKREDIATALGIPMTLLWSTQASGLGGGGVVGQDDQHFYDKTIVPECKLIQGILNEQLFEPMDLHFEFEPESLDVFQEDENARSIAFKNYVDAGMKKSIVAQILGVELPEGMEYEELDEKDVSETPPQLLPFTGQLGAQPPPQAEPEEPEERAEQEAMRADLGRWKRKALKRGGAVEFESQYIPQPMAESIRSQLAAATNEGEIKAAFKQLRFIPKGAEEPLPPSPDMVDITDADIQEAIDLWNQRMPDLAGLLETGPLTWDEPNEHY